VSWCPTRAYGLESFHDHGCRCHEPRECKKVLRRIGLRQQYASQGGAASTRLPRRIGLRQKYSSQGDAVMTSETRRRPLHYHVLRSLGPASTKRLAGTSATTRASSPCRHLFVVLGTSIRVFQEYSEKQRPAQHLHRLFIVPKGHYWIHRRSPS
jgi:hypothetical protein